jgi:hypothetical protein
MARKSINGHRIGKDGLPETFGEVHDRLEMRRNAKALGAAGLIVGGLYSVFNGVGADYPFLRDVMDVLSDNLANNTERSTNLARIAQVFSGVAEIAGGIWMGASAAKDASKRRIVEGNMTSLGRDYRPGDRKRADAAAAAQAAIADGNEPS